MTGLMKYCYNDAMIKTNDEGGTNNALFVFFCGFWKLSGIVVAYTGRCSESTEHCLKTQYATGYATGFQRTSIQGNQYPKNQCLRSSAQETNV